MRGAQLPVGCGTHVASERQDPRLSHSERQWKAGLPDRWCPGRPAPASNSGVRGYRKNRGEKKARAIELRMVLRGRVE
ncbi:hypothetical protein NDU88_003700 [Pleurodeles waltl]|uniref:Uncharacterized protein n=1 Tax=Pleurodeles waltl TaxID=8319 RepID=A0AAV7LGA3_PLEWA|nr:hypothetical protein NDU88_003700 [Pleurodeles waltl]